MDPLSQFIWRTRYRDADAQPPEVSINSTLNRVACSAAAIEREPGLWPERFASILRDFRFLPGGRILAGAGTTRQVTLSNCFVMGLINDSIEGIFEALKEGALTMQQGGGVGYDFSTLRPRGARAPTTGAIASGPVSFMRVWDAMCGTIQSTGARRGAMMATLRCDHPDIEEFIDAKRTPDALSHFNLSVLIPDEFMQAVRKDEPWSLVFPERNLARNDSSVDIYGSWSGHSQPVTCRVLKMVRARELWSRLCNSAYDCAEPGVLFIDHINKANNLAYCETLSATNPCGEEPLPPYGSCNLGSLNLTAFIKDAFTPTAGIDRDTLRDTVAIAVRLLDDILEISRFPLFSQREQAHKSRRLGLGITGLADALAMLCLRYDTEPARARAADIMREIRDAAYAASVELAREKGPFPALHKDRYLEGPFIRALPAETQAGIREHGIRNSHLLAIAPTGTISLLAGNLSSGIEPIFGIETIRNVLDDEGKQQRFEVADYAYAQWRALQKARARLPDYFIHQDAVLPEDHLLMQAALQPYVDGAISKTIRLPQSSSREGVPALFELAHSLRVKGCTLFREGARASVVLDRSLVEPMRERDSRLDCCD